MYSNRFFIKDETKIDSCVIYIISSFLTNTCLFSDIFLSNENYFAVENI